MGKYNWSHIEKIRKHPEIIGLLCGKDRRTKMHGDWIKYIWNGKYEHRALQACRGSMKTSAITEEGTIYWLMFHPNDRIAILRKSYSESCSNLRNICNMMMQDDIRELLGIAWGDPNWKFTVKRNDRFEISAKKSKTKEVSVQAFGMNSSFVGLHLDWAVFDDAVTILDRLSMAECEHTKLIYQEFKTNIVDPGKGCALLGTPWSRTDAFEVAPIPLKYDIYKTGLFTPEQIEKKRAECSSTMFSINYLLEHSSSEDCLFRNTVFGDWDISYQSETVAHIDAAYGGADACALTLMKPIANNKICAIGKRFKGHIKDWIPDLAKYFEQFKVKRLYMERNADKGFSMDAIMADSKVAALNIWPKPYDESVKKELKIAKWGYEGWPRIQWDSTYTDEDYLMEVNSWSEEGDGHDDCADSLSSLLRESKLVVVRDWKALYE